MLKNLLITKIIRTFTAKITRSISFKKNYNYMKKISLLLVALLTLFACKKNANFNSDPMLFKAYISGYTSGLVSAHSEVKILLNQPIAQDKMDKIESLDLFSISTSLASRPV